MKIEQLPVAGAYLVTPTLHRDHRGEFGEVFVAPAIDPALATGLSISQINTSWSRRGTLRGLHVSTAAHGQAKLVLCPSGTVLDIIVDARDESPTFGQHAVCTLDSQTRACLLIPPGVAHSFLALTDATVTYACSTVHDPDREIAIDALDPDLDLPWPRLDPLIQSTRDRAAHSWARAIADGWLPIAAQQAQ